MTARILAAIPLNYLVTSLATACLARLLPLARSEATIAATLSSFAIFAVVAMLAFSGRSSLRLWCGLVSATIVLGALLLASLSLRVQP